MRIISVSSMSNGKIGDIYEIIKDGNKEPIRARGIIKKIVTREDYFNQAKTMQWHPDFINASVDYTYYEIEILD